MAKLTHFEELEAWKACREVVRWVRRIARQNFPKDYDLKDNMSRAARSTTRNLAEGFGRHHHGENIQYARISRGSLYEVWDDAISAKEDGYLTSEEFSEGVKKIETAITIVNGYIRYLNSLL